MAIVQKILTHDGKFQIGGWPPADADIHHQITAHYGRWNTLSIKYIHVAEAAVDLNVLGRSMDERKEN